jgi:hypothetical protein
LKAGQKKGDQLAALRVSFFETGERRKSVKLSFFTEGSRQRFEQWAA